MASDWAGLPSLIRYEPSTWQAVGKSLGVSALDVLEMNPRSRLGGTRSAEMAMNLQRVSGVLTSSYLDCLIDLPSSTA